MLIGMKTIKDNKVNKEDLLRTVFKHTLLDFISNLMLKVSIRIRIMKKKDNFQINIRTTSQEKYF